MLIDLSVTLDETTPVYPGDPATKITPAGLLNEHGYQDHVVCVGTHVGTHIDAPSHMLGGGKDLDAFPLAQFMGRAVCVDVGQEITLAAIQAANIQEGDIVLLRTGMSERYQKPEYFTDYPVVPEDVAQYFANQKIKLLGLDSASPDHSPFPIHKSLLAHDILIIENLTNLSAVVGKEFTLYAFPMKIPFDGAPVRVVADVA